MESVDMRGRGFSECFSGLSGCHVSLMVAAVSFHVKSNNNQSPHPDSQKDSRGEIKTKGKRQRETTQPMYLLLLLGTLILIHNFLYSC